MHSLLLAAESIVSKLGHPSVALDIANRLIDRQNVELEEGASVSRGCIIRGDVTMGPQSHLSSGCVLEGDIRIGEGTNLQNDIEVIGDVRIGKYCALARDILFQQKNHKTSQPAMQMRFYNAKLDSKLEHTSKGPITVGHDVWIGARAIILSGVTIGNGAVVGAGSIVTDDVEPYSVVAGVPAKHRKWRFSREIRDRIQDVAWWDWNDSTIREHKEFFNSDIEDVDDIPDVDR